MRRHSRTYSGGKSERFRQFYNNAKMIARDINDMSVDYAKLRDIRHNKTQDAINKAKWYVYETYHINQYENREDFIEAMKENKFTKYSDAELEKLWKQYEHRDMLIETGQYEEYRINAYRNKYIAALKIEGVNQNVIDNIKKLSNEEFASLVGTNDARVDNDRVYLLPILGQFDYHIMGIKANSKIIEIEDEIKNAFKEVGLPFNENLNPNENIEFEPEMTTNKIRRTFARLTRGQSIEYQRFANEDDYKLAVYELLEDMINSGKKIYKDYGDYSVLAFVGSSKPESPNSELVQDFRNWINHRH